MSKTKDLASVADALQERGCNECAEFLRGNIHRLKAWEHKDEKAEAVMPILYTTGELTAEQKNALKAHEQAIIERFLKQSGKYVTNDASRQSAILSAFDAAVAFELPYVSSIQYNSHDICEWFAANVRDRLEKLVAQAPDRKVCANTCMEAKFERKPCRCYPGASPSISEPSCVNKEKV